MAIKLLLFTLVGFSLRSASGDAALHSNGHVGEGLSKVHVVHLRTGTIDVAAAHDRLPLPTPTARRTLLQQQEGATLSPPPTQSSGWGPLARTQLWLLTLGPSLHWHEDGQHLLTHSRDTVHSHSIGGRFFSTSVVGGASASPDSSPQHFGKAQTSLMKALHAVGCALVSFLPPAAWLLAVADAADLTPILEAFPDVRLAPYGPSRLRVSPELAATLDLLSQAGDAVAERIAAGERLDELIDEARKEKSGWLLGAMRKHMPTRGSVKAEGNRLAGVSRGRTSKGNRGPADSKGEDSESAAALGGTQPGRVQLEVHFPYLEPSDLAILSSNGQKPELDISASESSGSSIGAGGDGDGGGLSSYHPAAAAAADWSAALAALSPPDCPPILEPDFGSHEVLLLSLCPLALKETVEWLAAAPQVSWLAPRMATRMHDNLVAGAIVQTGGMLAAASNASFLSSHPFWAVGLNGSNQIVGCGDSGLDFGQCFFYDESVDVSANIQVDSNSMQYFSDARHRKLRYYLALVQDMVDSFGHGTHVSGTLVGSRFDRPDVTAEPLATGTGQAPGAKIAFMDLSRYNSDGVWTPGDLYRSYFNMTYRVGARVHSDSWGSEMTAYDTMSVSLDRFTFNNQDFVSVFAAGNYGDKSASSSRGTVTSPAVAKNCIAVGATLTMRPVAGRERWVPMVNMTVMVNLPGAQRFTRSVRVVKASFGISLDQAGLSNAGLAVASPENACTTLANAGAVSGRVVLVQRGGCYFTDKSRYAAAAGARAILVYNDVKDSGYFSMSPPADNSATGLGTIAAGSVPLSTGLWIKAAVAAGSVTVQISNIVQPEYPYFEDIAAYSSVGPTTDGRIKPDIVAPGTLLSANSSRTVPARGPPSCDNSIALVAMSGTSMATPVVAGSALLVRQYFVDGFYPDGVRDPRRGFPPSGPLVKAVLLGGAAHMMGVVEDTGMPLEDAPSYRQGFGRLSLLHALPLASNPSGPGWRLQVVDGVRDGAVLSESEQHQFCVTASGGPLKITLVWYDFPGEQAAARALVNNLNLEVRASGRGLLLDYGNGVQDNVNTVEQVWYDDLTAGDVAITVRAVSIFQKAYQQPYALVVQGKFSGTLRAPANGSSNTCAAQLAVILDDTSTPLFTKNTNLTFYYTTQDGNSQQVIFECRLIQQGSNTTGGWSNCSFPSCTYVGVSDGRYTFQVRVAGEQVAASRSVLVDSAPPIITLSSILADDTTTASDNATFIFSATDASSVTFSCRVDYSNGPRSSTTVPYLRFGARTAAAPNANSSTVGKQVPIKETFTCLSPLEFVGMAYGDYVLLVRAVDVTENGADAQLSWKIRFLPDDVYVRMVSGPLGLVANRSLQYGVVGFLGSQAESTPPDDMSLHGSRYEYTKVAQLPAAGEDVVLSSHLTLRDVAKDTSWQPMLFENVTSASAPASLQLNLAADGSYLVLVRYQDSPDPITWGMASVQVDTTPPVVVITRAPNSYQSDPVVTIRFADNGTDDDTRAFFCRWMGNTTTRPDPNTPDMVEPFSSCRDSASFNVTDGFWLFQVKGQDAAGNIGFPDNASFVTDLEPPVITYTLPNLVNYSRLEWNYTISDNGSEVYNGSTNSSCAFRWVQLENASVRVDGDNDYPPARQNPPWRSPCPRPPFRFTLQEGRYLWSVAANDQAGLRVSKDVTVLADFSKPYSRVLISNRRLPSKFTVTIISIDLPKTINSGVVQQECKIDAASAPPPASPPSPPPSQVPPSPPQLPPSPTASNGRVAAARPPTFDLSSSSSDGGGRGGARRSLQQQGSDTVPRLYHPSAPIQMGVWHVCDEGGKAANVTYEGFSTGYYTFSLRARDAAGNQGNATTPAFFTVDASLPTDGSDSVQVNRSDDEGTSNRTKKIVIVVAVIVAVVVFIAFIVGIFLVRRRGLRKYEARAAQVPPSLAMAVAASQGIAMQPMPARPPPPPSPSAALYSNGTTNGYSNGSHAPPSLAAPSDIAGIPLAAPLAVTPGAGPYYPPQPPVVGGAVVAGVPYTADPVLAAALAVSAEEAQRARAAEDAERARVAALAAEDEQRLRRAIAASLEEENLRRAKEASLHAAVQQTSEHAALEAAIAASLATAEQERQRQQQRAAQQQQQQQQQQPRPPPPASPQPPPTAPPAGPPDYGLI